MEKIDIKNKKVKHKNNHLPCILVSVLAVLAALFLGDKALNKEVDDTKALAMSDMAVSEYGVANDMDASVKIPVSVYVPDLRGLTSVEAKKMAEQYKLFVGEIKEEYSDTVKKGEAIKQSPDKNATANIGTAMKIVISKGEELMSVPKLTGISVSAAKKNLKKYKLKCKVKEKYSTVDKGKVIAQSIKSGKKVKKGTTVTISVSKGKKYVKPKTPSYQPTQRPVVTSRPAPTKRPVATRKPAPTKKPASPKKPSSKKPDNDDFDISDW